MRTSLHAMVAAAIAGAIPLGVWPVNGFLPMTAIVLGLVAGLAYWYWRPDPTV